MALEWLFGGEAVGPAPPPAVTSAGETQPSVAPDPTGSLDAGDEPDYSRYRPWTKTREETRKLFLQLRTLMVSLGNVRTDAFKSEISFKCLDAPGRQKVIAYVAMRIREVCILLTIAEKHLHGHPLEDGFSRPSPYKGYREITIRDDADIQRAEPLVRAAYNSLSESQSRAESPRSAAARKAWQSRKSQGAAGAR